jgi:dTDP-4-amino-4,6-dideoxygalactose transaminase
MIPFNKPPVTGKEIQFIQQAISGSKLSGDGYFAKKCEQWFVEKTGCVKSLLTPALLIDIQPGDEIIMPSYTFVSTANAFALRGAKIVFVDIRPDTMNIDENLIEQAITPKTKAIVPVHYAGVACEMDTIMAIADKFSLYVIEDAAQGVMSSYKGRALGSIGHLAAYSFHETKNYTSGGEGGLLLINDEKLVNRAEIIREKGTNRSQFFRGMVDKYTWVDIGSSLLPSEIQAAYLWPQLNEAKGINERRLELWNRYLLNFKSLEEQGLIELPSIPTECEHNAHMFYIKLSGLSARDALISSLRERNISSAFHYVPLHTAPAGLQWSRFDGHDQFTTQESERLLRLPLFYSLTDEEQALVCQEVINALLELKN